MKEYQSDSDEPLVDRTQVLPRHSKKLERQKRKQEKHLQEIRRKAAEATKFSDLPVEILLEITKHLQVYEIFKLTGVCIALKDFIDQHSNVIAKYHIKNRFSVLARSFPRPYLLEHVDIKYHHTLLSARRQKMLEIHKRPYQHIQPHDGSLICSCLTCVLAWNNLCLIVDLAYWQDTFDNRRRIPIIERGTRPDWNVALVVKSAEVVEKALKNRLWYTCILEKHLKTTIRTIRRYNEYWSCDTSDKTPFRLTQEDVLSQTDSWLTRNGNGSEPPYDFLVARDSYLHFAPYIPSRRWNNERSVWLYQPDDQHFQDLEWTFQAFEGMTNHEPPNQIKEKPQIKPFNPSLTNNSQVSLNEQRSLKRKTFADIDKMIRPLQELAVKKMGCKLVGRPTIPSSKAADQSKPQSINGLNQVPTIT